MVFAKMKQAENEKKAVDEKPESVVESKKEAAPETESKD